MSSSSDTEALQHVCNEARYTINNQVSKIHLEGRKAVGITRLNLLLLGLFASAISITLRTTDVSTAEFLNLHVAVGTTCLIMSTIVSSMAYTSSQFKVGVNTKPVKRVREGEMNDKEYLKTLSDRYKEWIIQNRKVHKYNATAITWALTFALGGLMFFIIGLGIGIGEFSGTEISNILLLSGVMVTMFLTILLHRSDWFFEVIMDISNNDTNSE